ncbi:hypothetical protein HK101_000421, partial [Irineochytrium annulatum]
MITDISTPPKSPPGSITSTVTSTSLSNLSSLANRRKAPIKVTTASVTGLRAVSPTAVSGVRPPASGAGATIVPITPSPAAAPSTVNGGVSKRAKTSTADGTSVILIPSGPAPAGVNGTTGAPSEDEAQSPSHPASRLEAELKTARSDLLHAKNACLKAKIDSEAAKAAAFEKERELQRAAEQHESFKTKMEALIAKHEKSIDELTTGKADYYMKPELEAARQRIAELEEGNATELLAEKVAHDKTRLDLLMAQSKISDLEGKLKAERAQWTKERKQMAEMIELLDQIEKQTAGNDNPPISPSNASHHVTDSHMLPPAAEPSSESHLPKLPEKAPVITLTTSDGPTNVNPVKSRTVSGANTTFVPVTAAAAAQPKYQRPRPVSLSIQTPLAPGDIDAAGRMAERAPSPPNGSPPVRVSPTKVLAGVAAPTQANGIAGTDGELGEYLKMLAVKAQQQHQQQHQQQQQLQQQQHQQQQQQLQGVAQAWPAAATRAEGGAVAAVPDATTGGGKESTVMKAKAALWVSNHTRPGERKECDQGTVALKAVQGRPGTGRLVMYDDKDDRKVLNLNLTRNTSVHVDGRDIRITVEGEFKMSYIVNMKTIKIANDMEAAISRSMSF